MVFKLKDFGKSVEENPALQKIQREVRGEPELVKEVIKEEPKKELEKESEEVTLQDILIAHEQRLNNLEAAFYRLKNI